MVVAMSADDLTEYVRATFALDPSSPAALTPGARGALGQISRLEIGSHRYAVKELFDDEAPAAALITAEVEFTALAAAAGVCVAASHPAADGRYAVPMPGGSGWLRLYDWLDAGPPDLGADDLPALLGALLGRLHGCAPASDREPDGSPPDEWFDVAPADDGWPPLIDAALAAGATWAPDLAARLPLIQTITALALPADTAAMITCHRDLHPENVLVIAGGEGDAGQLAVIDWDNLGPADPSRELVRVLLDWFFDHDALDADAVRGMLAAYRATGAPARIADDAFGFVIASRLNFLRRQVGIALDAAVEERHRDWAGREIDEGLRILPTPAVFAQLIEVDAALG
jgi:Ser/Thr protein kinase RdoA (MazF antagonist)